MKSSRIRNTDTEYAKIRIRNGISVKATIINALQEALDNLTHWADEWGMDFNIKKCKVVHFGRSNKCYEYTIRGQKL
jgi:ribonucleases P/MRP protein subunit RPP40